MKNRISYFLTFVICCLLLPFTCFALETKSTGDPINTNFPKDAEGRVYHLGIKKGEVANRILLVGDPERAKLIVEQLDPPKEVFIHASNRGFIPKKIQKFVIGA